MAVLRRGCYLLKRNLKGDTAITNYLHSYDLPDGVTFNGDIAVDTEAMGLNNHRDRLCVVQMSDGKGDVHLVHFPEANYKAPRLKAVLSDPKRVKIFHFARFDLAIIQKYLEIDMKPVYCTKLASRLCRTYTDRHGLKDLCRELLDVELSKQQQTSNWGAPALSDAQVAYAASDVLHLHQLRDRLNELLDRVGRRELAQKCFDFLPTRAALDLEGWPEIDIFAHS